MRTFLMVRKSILMMCLTLPLMAQAASLKDYTLNQTLQSVAKKSSVGTPRAINSDLTDNGYTVQDNTLINHIAVSNKQANQMRSYPTATRKQLTKSVCMNKGFRELLQSGAILSYQFLEKTTKKPITEELFFASDCAL